MTPSTGRETARKDTAHQRLGPSREAVGNWKHVFTDAAAWSPLLAEILRRHGLGRLESATVGVPGSNAVFIVNERHVVKVYWPRFAEDMAREIEAHRLLFGLSGVPIPRLIAHGVIHEHFAWHYAVSERLPGRPLSEVHDLVPPTGLAAIAEAFGSMVAVLHAVTLPETGPLADDQSGWVAFLARRTAQAVEHHAGDLSAAPHLLDEMPQYLADAGPLVPPDFQPVVLHADLTADHLLVTERKGGWRITGLIDWGDVETGHVDYEWIALHTGCFRWDAGLTRRFLEAYGYAGLDEHFPRRMAAYSLLHRWATLGETVDHLGGPRAVRSLSDVERRVWEPVLGA